MDREVIHIIWDGPYNFIEYRNFNNKEIDFGLYQIYGPHPVYGANVLLFIGKTTDEEMPFALTFGDAISTEIWGDNIDHKLLNFYLGRICGETTPNDSEWLRQISLAEMLLVEAHATALNKEPVVLFANEYCKNIHVLNWGSYNQLLPEISGLRWAAGTGVDSRSNPPIYKRRKKRIKV